MESIRGLLPDASIVKRAEKTLFFKDRWLNSGFTMVSNRMLEDTSVTIQAKYLYILLMRRVFQKDFCYPGEVKLSKEMGYSDRMIRTYLGELKEKGWLKVKQRGLGKTNLYFLLKK